MNLYRLISNYESSNKYTKYLNICVNLFNVVATIIQVRGWWVKHCKVIIGAE
jgi:hypothetical protein